MEILSISSILIVHIYYNGKYIRRYHTLRNRYNHSGSGSTKNITMNTNPQNCNGGIRYSIIGMEIFRNNNNTEKNFKGSMTEVKVTIGAKTENKKDLFKFFQERIV